MPGRKISALTGGGAAQATDEFVVARAGGNNKITGADIAAAATSVGTLTSLTVSGNLAVDTNTLFVDAANNNVGIGTASPTTILQASSSSSSSGLAIAAPYPTLALYDSSGTTGTGSLAQFNADTILLNKEAGSIILGTSNVERARIDASGNLGLGVTPSAWSFGGNAVLGEGAYYTFKGARGYLAANVYYDGVNRYAAAQPATMYEQNYGVHTWLTAPSGGAGSAGAPITFTQAMTLDASGLLGIGTASPDARLTIFSATGSTNGINIKRSGGWSSVFRLGAQATSGDEFWITNNYNPATSAADSGEAGYIFYATANEHRWITNTAERMRLDITGNLGVGTASPSDSSGFGRTLDLAGAAGQGAALYVRAGASSTNYIAIGQDTGGNSYILNRANGAMLLYTNNTERARIKAGGQFRFVPLAAAPAGAENGDVYYDSTTNKLRVYAGGAWTDLH